MLNPFRRRSTHSRSTILTGPLALVGLLAAGLAGVAWRGGPIGIQYALVGFIGVVVLVILWSYLRWGDPKTGKPELFFSESHRETMAQIQRLGDSTSGVTDRRVIEGEATAVARGERKP